MARLARSAAVAALASLLMAGTASAGTIRCGGQVFDDGARTGVFEHVILEHCGEPDQRYGSTWVYERPDGSRVVVEFGSDGELESIEEKL